MPGQHERATLFPMEKPFIPVDDYSNLNPNGTKKRINRIGQGLNPEMLKKMSKPEGSYSSVKPTEKAASRTGKNLGWAGNYYDNK
jgi:hypothetical protein